MTQDHQHTLDLVCGTSGTGGAAVCLTLLEVMPIILQIASLLSLSLSIAWFIYRFYKVIRDEPNPE